MLSFFPRSFVPHVVLLPPTYTYTHIHTRTRKNSAYIGIYSYRPYAIFARGSLLLYCRCSSGSAAIWSNYTRNIDTAVKCVPSSQRINAPSSSGFWLDNDFYLNTIINYILCILYLIYKSRGCRRIGNHYPMGRVIKRPVDRRRNYKTLSGSRTPLIIGCSPFPPKR